MALEAPPFPPVQRSLLWCVILALIFAFVLFMRIAAPSDLDTKDQPKTISYTADMLVNQRWLWPRDMLGNPATKPPMYNWLSAPGVYLLGYKDWVLKLPSMVGGLAVLLMTMGMARRLMRATGETDATRLTAGGALAGAAWIANVGTTRLIYTARPDMVLAVFLVAGSALGTKLLAQERGRRWPAQVGLWLCVGGAALTKGPAAAILPIYLVLAAWLCRGDWRLIRRTGVFWGWALAAAVVVAWFVPALQSIGGLAELHSIMSVEQTRMVGLDRWAWFRSVHELPMYFVLRFTFWAGLFVAALLMIPPRRWFGHALGPAILWTLLVTVFFSVPAIRRDDYLLPAYPTGGIVAAWLVLSWRPTRWRAPALGALAAALALCVGIGVNDWVKDRHAVRYGQNTADFATMVARRVGTARLVFVDCGYNPLQTFLGRNQASPRPSPADWEVAEWVIEPVAPGRLPVIESRKIPDVIDRRGAAILGLYRRGDVPSPF